MKYLIALLLLINPLTDLDKIAQVNKLKKEAKTAFNKGDYNTAIDKYNYLLDSMQVEDDNIKLNLANAYYKTNDSTSAVNSYNNLLSSKDKVVKSVAHQQLGIMADRAKKFDEALSHFKSAIKTNPANDEARYNYEMLKKMLDEQEKNQQDQKNKDDQNKDQEKKDQENKDQQNKDQQQQNKDQEKQDQENKEKQEEQNEEGKEGEQKDEEQQKQKDQQEKEGEKEKKEEQKPQEGEENEDKKGDEEQMNSISDKLKEMKISEEKAKMILEALKNNEIQYYQQNKRKPTKRKDPDKPDW